MDYYLSVTSQDITQESYTTAFCARATCHLNSEVHSPASSRWTAAERPVTRRTDMNVFMSHSARSYRDDISPNRGRRRKFESDSDIRVVLMPRRGSRRFDLTRVGKVGRCCLRLRDGSRQAKYADSGGHEMARYRTRDWRPLLSPAGYTGTGNGTSRRGNGYPRYVGGRRCALSPGDADLTISHGRY